VLTIFDPIRLVQQFSRRVLTPSHYTSMHDSLLRSVTNPHTDDLFERGNVISTLSGNIESAD